MKSNMVVVPIYLMVLLNKERISTFSVGMGAGSELHNKNGDMILETRPQIQFAYTLSVGF